MTHELVEARVAGVNGVLVEVVSADGPAAGASVRVGDRLLAYADRPLYSPAALLAAEENVVGGDAPRTLCVQRTEAAGTHTHWLSVPAAGTPLGIEVRPGLPPATLAGYEAGKAALNAQRVDEAIRLWEAVAQQAGEDANAAAWLKARVGALYQQERQWTQAQAAYQSCWSLLQAGDDAAAKSQALLALGQCRQNLNDLPGAASWYDQAQQTALAAGNELWAAAALNNLGIVAWGRGDLDAAQGYYAQALTLRQRLVPGSAAVARVLNNLGLVVRARGDLDAAHNYHIRALDIHQRVVRRDSLEASHCLNNLGIIAWERGDLDAAHDFYARGLHIDEQLAPESLDVAYSLNNLGALASKRGDLPAAHDYYSRALSLLERLAPASLEEAMARNNLGWVAYERGDLLAARDSHKRAVHIIEDLRQRLPLAEARALFLAHHNSAEAYYNLLRTLTALHDLPAAFTAFEGVRARALVELLAEQSLVLEEDAGPSPLRTKRHNLAETRQTCYQRLSRFNAREDAAQIEQIHQEIRQIAVQERALETALRGESPRSAAAALQYVPPPDDLALARQTLDADTLLLEYAVDEDAAYLFALSQDDQQLYRLPIACSDLSRRVHAFRAALARRGAYRDEARALYDLLLRPAQTLLDRAERLLLCPDGPLHALPLAALIEALPGAPPSAAERFLVEAKPLHTIASMRLYAQLRQVSSPGDERGAPSGTLLALGDPAYDAAAPGTPSASEATHAFVTGGGQLTPLPSTRKEVRAIGKLYGEQAIVRLGKRATRSEVLRHAGGARVLHFACHGLLDDQDPLASALALTPAGENDDGLLRAYEIITQMRLAADLVVLSACSMGLGREMRTEGVIGMTRALQHAGAKTVLVSLWEIQDTSTADLMVAFHRALRAGAPKDEALQQAQLLLLRGKNDAVRHPFHWAAFTLTGDRL